MILNWLAARGCREGSQAACFPGLWLFPASNWEWGVEPFHASVLLVYLLNEESSLVLKSCVAILDQDNQR